VRLDAALPAGVEVDMYYGNPDAPPTSDGPATWATDYVSVHHLHGLTDATGSGHDASSQLPPTNTTGLVAGAQYFDGNDDFLTLAGEGDYDFATELTAEAWIRVEAFDVDWQAIVNKGDDAWRLQRALNTSAINFGSDPPNHNLNGTAPVDDGQWHHVAIVYGAGIKRIYVDGTQDVEAPLAGPLTDTDADVTLGSNVDAGGRNFFGAIDEVRISSVARSRDYFEWQRASVGLPGVVAVGAEQSCVER
jgi:biopolymer transport protein ExbB